MKSSKEAKASILIIEDEAIVAFDLQVQLQQAGFPVVGTAAYGEAAINIWEEKHPNVVLLDIILRGQMNGIEVAL